MLFVKTFGIFLAKNKTKIFVTILLTAQIAVIYYVHQFSRLVYFYKYCIYSAKQYII